MSTRLVPAWCHYGQGFSASQYRNRTAHSVRHAHITSSIKGINVPGLFLLQTRFVLLHREVYDGKASFMSCGNDGLSPALVATLPTLKKKELVV